MLAIAIAAALSPDPLAIRDEVIDAALDAHYNALDNPTSCDYFHLESQTQELTVAHPYRMTHQAFRCPPEFTFLCEMDLAATYSLSQPDLAADCARFAHDAALEARRPDLAFAANDLLAAIGGDK